MLAETELIEPMNSDEDDEFYAKEDFMDDY